MDLLSEQDLKSELRALKGSYEEICNSSFDYIAVMEEEDASGFAQDVADVRKRLQECRTKYQDTEMKMKKTLWSRFAYGQFGGLKADLETVFGQAEALQAGHMTTGQYDLLHTALESRVKALKEFVRDWDRYVPEKDVDVMQVCLKDYKEKRRMTIVELNNYMRRGKRSVHGALGVLIADNIVLELQDLPAVRNNQPREALQLIQAVERVLLDLIDLGCEDAIKNQLVIRSLEIPAGSEDCSSATGAVADHQTTELCQSG
ncbi:hypothetical protein D9C73_024453 [Collichthys lucidus]|uniref:Uncharacterized protein n=1 Tax=Collichthys lucidus TaxID=240159 RepID=A0A4V6ATW3_COLLU|nr:hypothetical protein D9C73_024453 [Collichthys lucidus]